MGFPPSTGGASHGCGFVVFLGRRRAPTGSMAGSSYFLCQRSPRSRAERGPSPSSQRRAAGSSRSQASQKAVVRARITRWWLGLRGAVSPGRARSVNAECSAPSSTSSYFPPGGRAGKTASLDSRSAPPIGARSFVPVIRSQGIATAPKACDASPPRRGRLGLIAIAAVMRGSVNERPPRNCWPLTACVVTAPNAAGSRVCGPRPPRRGPRSEVGRSQRPAGRRPRPRRPPGQGGAGSRRRPGSGGGPALSSRRFGPGSATGG